MLQEHWIFLRHSVRIRQTPVNTILHPYLLLNHPAEIQRVLIPYDFGNFLDVVGCPLQQTLCVDHAQGEDVLGRGHTSVLFEIVYKPVGADVQGFRVIIYDDHIIILERKNHSGVAAVPLWVRGLYCIAVQRYSAVGGPPTA